MMEKTFPNIPKEPHKNGQPDTIKKAVWIILTAVFILTVSINLFHFLSFPNRESQILPQKVSGFTDQDEGKYKGRDDSKDKPEIIFEYGKVSQGIYHGTIEYDTEHTKKITFSAMPREVCF